MPNELPVNSPDFVVGIGASAGGIEPVKILFTRFKHDSTAFVLAMHLSPDHRSHLAEVLQKYCSLELTMLEAPTTPIARNNVYLVPPAASVTLEDGALVLGPLGPQPRRTIDTLFLSLAAELGERSIGIVLSGLGSDGAVGLKAIRKAGGLTFVQSPQSAEFSSMPQSAKGSARFSMEPAALGDELMARIANGWAAPVPSPTP